MHGIKQAILFALDFQRLCAVESWVEKHRQTLEIQNCKDNRQSTTKIQ